MINLNSLSLEVHIFLPKCNTNSLRIGDNHVDKSSCIKLLGVYMDENLNLKHHISMKARAAALAMFNLKKIYLSQNCKCLNILTYGLL